MAQTWVVTLPFILVIIATLITRNVLVSLGLGIISACIIAAQANPYLAATIAYKNIWQELTSADHVYIFIFLIALGIIIELIAQSGALYTYAKILQKKIRSARAVQTTSLTASLFLFADDYLNILVTGSLIRPLTDSWKVPRVKLAYLLNAVSGPLCVIFPLSSWIAMILAQMDASGISMHMTQKPLILADPFGVYLLTIPFLFYPLLSVFSAWFVVLKDISFGYMKKCEKDAQQTGCVAIKEQQAQPKEQKNGTILDFVAPIAILLGLTILGLLYSGNYWLLGGKSPLLEAIMMGDLFWALCIGSVTALTYTISNFTYKKTHSLSEMLTHAKQATLSMLPPILTLILAWTFSALLKDYLHTGTYLANLVLQIIAPWLLPCITFVLAAITTASIGSAWGTIAVFFPIVIPMSVALYPVTTPTLLATVPMLTPILGATISGAIAGSHLSPISDATVMAATGAGADHITHVKTQIAYSMPPFIGSIIGYSIIGAYQSNAWSTIALGYAGALAITVAIYLLKNKKSPQQ